MSSTLVILTFRYSYDWAVFTSFLADLIAVYLFFDIISNPKGIPSNEDTISNRSFLAICVLVFSLSAIFHVFSIFRYFLVCYILISCFRTININRIDPEVITSNRSQIDFNRVIKFFLTGFTLFIAIFMSSYTIAAYSVASSVAGNNGYLEWHWIPPGTFYPWPNSPCDAGSICLQAFSRSDNRVNLFIFKYFIEPGFFVLVTGLLWVIVGYFATKALQYFWMTQMDKRRSGVI